MLSFTLLSQMSREATANLPLVRAMRTANNSSLHYLNCNLCEAICGIEIEHDNGKILSIKGDKNDPFSRGHICPKALALKEIYEDKIDSNKNINVSSGSGNGSNNSPQVHKKHSLAYHTSRILDDEIAKLNLKSNDSLLSDLDINHF